MITPRDRIIWSIEPRDFNESGELHNYIQKLTALNFEDFIEFELANVRPFLLEWESLLKKENCETGAIKESIDLQALFRKAPELSGVVYYSDNSVICEQIFEEHPEQLVHLTDKVLQKNVRESLPCAQNLSFSFPRKYTFEGYANGWGFARVERENSAGNGAAVALSVTTLDQDIMRLLKKYDSEPLAELYNQVWDYAIHDYIHHIAIYTNPSFAIGKRSPMSIAQENDLIDRWGASMVDTFNYEFWAHSTHRKITEAILSSEKKAELIKKAKVYFREVKVFQEKILNAECSDRGRQLAHKVGSYLTFIYLWPLHILLPPYGREIEELRKCINALDVGEVRDVRKYVLKSIAETGFPDDLIARIQLFLALKQHLDKKDYVEIISKLESIISHSKLEKLFPEKLSDFECLQCILDRSIQVSSNLEKALMEALNFDRACQNKDLVFEKFLEESEKFTHSAKMIALSETFRALGIRQKLTSSESQLEWFDLILLKTDLVAQRGSYENWFHDQPIIFDMEPITPMSSMLKFLEAFYETFPRFQEKIAQIEPYHLTGISV